jgi:hypothetical protein
MKKGFFTRTSSIGCRLGFKIRQEYMFADEEHPQGEDHHFVLSLLLSDVVHGIHYKARTSNRRHCHGPRSTYRPASLVSSPLRS